MSQLVWDVTSTKTYRTGVNKTALYVIGDDGTYGKGVAWQGVSAINESPSGGDQTKIYADNVLYLTLTAAEEFAATIEAYDSPEEFDACDGVATAAAGVKIGQQTRRAFGLVWQTRVANDVVGEDYGYEINIAYNMKASPSSKNNSTISDSPEAETLSWEATSTPVSVTGFNKPTSILRISSLTCDTAKLKELENKLYGTEESDPTFLLPDEVIKIVGIDGVTSNTEVAG